MEENWSPCLHTLEGHNIVLYSVAWSPDESGRVASSGDQCVYIWDSNTGQCLRELKGHTGYVRIVAWSPDCTGRLASGSDDGIIKVWNSVNGLGIFTLKGHRQDIVQSISWSKDGRRLASASGDTAVRIWDTTSGLLISAIEEPNVNVFSVSWSPGEIDRLASQHDGRSVHILEPATGECMFTLAGFDKPILSVAWSPDGNMLGLALESGTIEIWRLTADHGQRLFVINQRNIKATESNEGDKNADPLIPLSFCPLSWSKDGKGLAFSANGRTLTYWDVTNEHCLFTFEGHFDTVFSVACSQDGTRLASSSFNGTVKIWDLTSGQGYFISGGDDRAIDTMTWSHDVQKLASVSGSEIKIWDSTKGQCILNFRAHDDSDGIRGVQWSMDGSQFSSVSNHGTLNIWDATTGNCKLTLARTDQDQNDEPMILFHAWSPDGNKLAASKHHAIHIWDSTSGKLLAYLGRHPDLGLISWSPNGGRLASSAVGGIIMIWDIITGQCGLTLKPKNDDDSKGHEPYLISWSTDGNQIALYSGAYSARFSNIQIWDTSTGDCTFSCRGFIPQTRFLRFGDGNPKHIHTSWGVLDTSDPDVDPTSPRFLSDFL